MEKRITDHDFPRPFMWEENNKFSNDASLHINACVVLFLEKFLPLTSASQQRAICGS